MGDLYNVFQHRIDGRVIWFNQSMFESPEEKRLRRMRGRARRAVNWNLFLTLTYNNNNVGSAKSGDVSKFINNIKQRFRNRIVKFNREGKQHLVSSYRKKLSDFCQFWKVEFDSTGSRQINPHFHILLRTNQYLSKKRLEEWWGKGFITLKVIEGKKEAVSYVNKYFKKGGISKEGWAGRYWSASRNMPKVIKVWKFIGCLFQKEINRIYIAMTDGIIFGYKIEKLLKLAKKQKFMGCFG